MSGSRRALVLVGTPIGNLGDLRPGRPRRCAAADAVCCEDTRRTGKLLALAGIERRPFVVVNEHTEAREVPRVLARLDRGERVALVSDAGMPGISDPGERLVAAAVAAGHAGRGGARARRPRWPRWWSSGLPAGRFVFEGFLPRKGAGAHRAAGRGGRRAPHRRALRGAPPAGPHAGRPGRGVRGERRVAVARELTKLHEEVWRGTLAGPPPGRPSASRRARSWSCSTGAPAAARPDDDGVLAAVRAELAAGARPGTRPGRSPPAWPSPAAGPTTSPRGRAAGDVRVAPELVASSDPR